jgi:hypothetical protein
MDIRPVASKLLKLKEAKAKPGHSRPELWRYKLIADS